MVPVMRYFLAVIQCALEVFESLWVLVEKTDAA